jgi:hypothetical protein
MKVDSTWSLLLPHFYANFEIFALLFLEALAIQHKINLNFSRIGVLQTWRGFAKYVTEECLLVKL